MGRAKVESSGRSDLGRVREQNEDSFLVDDELGLYAVADGVGGQAAGEVASALALEAAQARVREWRNDPGGLDLVEAAQAAVEAASKAVHERAVAEHRHRGMSTTLTLVLVDDRAAMAHVGDSRLYLVRGGRIDQLSADHTIAAELGRIGAIEADQVERHPYSHVLTRSIGSQPSVLADTLVLDLMPEDTLVLSSDGLNPAVRDLSSMLGELGPDLERSASNLIDAANAAGGRDNTTVVLLRASGGAGASQSLPDLVRPALPFQNLSTAGLLRVISAGQVEGVLTGTTLLEPGQRSDRLFVVLEGELSWTVGESARTLCEGDSIGSSAVLHPTTSPGTLTATAPSRVLSLDSEQLARLVRRRRRLGSAVLHGIANTLARVVADSDHPSVQLSGF